MLSVKQNYETNHTFLKKPKNKNNLFTKCVVKPLCFHYIIHQEML